LEQNITFFGTFAIDGSLVTHPLASQDSCGLLSVTAIDNPTATVNIINRKALRIILIMILFLSNSVHKLTTILG